MTEQEYNGWTNYPTWAIASWLGDDETQYNRWWERTVYLRGKWTDKGLLADILADEMKQDIERKNPLQDKCNYWADFMSYALGQVNWREVAMSYVEAVTEG